MKRRSGFLFLLLAFHLALASGYFEAKGQETKGYAPINGLKMYYEIHGEGEPLVLLHGGGSSIQTTFGRVLPLLARHRQVIAVEQQGHGHTADIDRDFSFEQMADDTFKLLGHLNIARADFFGFSNGGSVALQMAIRHPEVVRKLVVGSTIYKRDGFPQAVFESFKKPIKPEQMPPSLREDYLKIAPHPENLQLQIEKLMKLMSGFKDWDEEDLKAIKAPTLLLVGDSDAVRVEHLLEMKRLISGARLAVIPGGHGEYLGEATNHLPPTGVIEGTVALIEGFVDGLYPYQGGIDE